MSWNVAGVITVATAGTAVNVAAQLGLAAGVPLNCQSVLIQALPTNTGFGAVGDAEAMDTSTGDRVLGYIATPASPGNGATAIPSLTVSIPLAPAGIDLRSLWLDAAVSGSKFIVSYTKQ